MKIFATHPPIRHIANTNSEEDDLRREFQHSAECGFAIANEERIDGVVFIAAGVYGFNPNSQGKYSFENVWLNDPKG